LDDEISNAVVKFNTPEYNPCQVNANKYAVRVICDRVDVLRGSIFPTSAELELLKSPVGYGSGTDLLKLFEAIARFLGSKTITLLTDESKLFLFRNGAHDIKSNKEIRSTVLMTLLSGKFKSYYTTLGYHYAPEERFKALRKSFYR
jgi:hypothetical protein